MTRSELLDVQRRGAFVRAFDPRTVGVVKHGRILNVGMRYARVDFGLSGSRRILFRDCLGEVRSETT